MDSTMKATLCEQPFVRTHSSYKIVDIVGTANPVNLGQLNGKKTAVISGAGIAGLAAAFELHAKGFILRGVEILRFPQRQSLGVRS